MWLALIYSTQDKPISWFPLCGTDWSYKRLKNYIVVLIKTVPWEMVMTLTDTFPTTPGMNPKESANKLWPTVSWLHSTKKKKGIICHPPFSLVWNPSEAVLHSRVYLWVPRNGNFCLMNLLWHILSFMLSLVENVSTVHPVISLRCHSPRQEEEEDAGTADTSLHPESHLQWLSLLHIDKERQMAGSLTLAHFDKIIQSMKLEEIL